MSKMLDYFGLSLLGIYIPAGLLKKLIALSLSHFFKNIFTFAFDLEGLGPSGGGHELPPFPLVFRGSGWAAGWSSVPLTRNRLRWRRRQGGWPV